MNTNEIVEIVIGAAVCARLAMIWVSKHKQKVQTSKVPMGGTTTTDNSPVSNSTSGTLGQRKVWGLSNKDSMTSKMLMRTELIGYVINEALLVALTSAGLYYIYASIVATQTALVAKFFANDLRTFKDRRSGRTAVRLLKFNMLGLVGTGINLSILYFATVYLHLPYSAGNLIGMAAGLPMYFLHVRFTWKKAAKEELKNIPAMENYQ
jgi:putative flippase GtrA